MLTPESHIEKVDLASNTPFYGLSECWGLCCRRGIDLTELLGFASKKVDSPLKRAKLPLKNAKLPLKRAKLPRKEAKLPRY